MPDEMTRNDAMIENAKILIVDDETANVVLLKRHLKRWGYKNLHATTDPYKGLSLYEQVQPDIILLDLIMPNLNGYQVMEHLKGVIPSNAYLPILVLTADTTAETKRLALLAGAKDFLTKPFDATELVLRITHLLEARFLHIELENQNQLLEQKVRERTRELSESGEQLRALAGRLTSIREDERTHIAREIHDELGQALTGLRLDLGWLSRKMASVPETSLDEEVAALIRDKFVAMGQAIDNTIKTVRAIATELRPSMLDDLGVVAAIEWQAQEFEKRTGVQCHFIAELEDSDLSALAIDQTRATTIFRIFQESLTNVARHAQASRVDVDLSLEYAMTDAAKTAPSGESDMEFVMRVQDNGRGIQSGQLAKVKSLGLLGMRERASMVGGTVQISENEQAGAGTTVTLRLPLQLDVDVEGIDVEVNLEEVNLEEEGNYSDERSD